LTLFQFYVTSKVVDGLMMAADGQWIAVSAVVRNGT